MTIDDVDWEPLEDDETPTEWALPQAFSNAWSTQASSPR